MSMRVLAEMEIRRCVRGVTVEVLGGQFRGTSVV